jgi:hypothetical protein
MDIIAQLVSATIVIHSLHHIIKTHMADFFLVVRTPDKLRQLLMKEHKITTAIMEKYLSIHQGDAKRSIDVSKALANPVNGFCLVDTVYTAIGAYPNNQFSLIEPWVLSDPTICETGMAALLSAINALASQGITKSQTGQKPLVIAISATAGKSITATLPWLMIPLYIWLLRGPHADKRKMEDLLMADSGKHTRDFVIVRPALLTDGVEQGVEKVRVGWELGNGGEARDAPGPAIGWTVSRKDVGGWVYKKAIVEGGWEGRCVSLCY